MQALPFGEPMAGAPPAQRLQALDADPRLNPFAQYERLQARQALAAVDTASRSKQPAALALADRRVAIAEQAARIEATRREIDRLERERSELLVEASRRDAERARAEAERLRIEAQVQAEEAARLRAQAEQAEAVLDTAQIDQGARVAAAREKEATLARKEAELVTGAKLPPVHKDAQGNEVFVLAGDAFGSGQAQLTAKAAAAPEGCPLIDARTLSATGALAVWQEGETLRIETVKGAHRLWSPPARDARLPDLSGRGLKLAAQ